MGVDVVHFFNDAIRAHKGVVESKNGSWKYTLTEVPRALRDMVGGMERFIGRFDLPILDDQIYLMRTHPIVEGMATYMMDTALDTESESAARRCGAVRTSQIDARTTALLVRFRYHIHSGQDGDAPLLAEDIQAYAFNGSPENAEWLESDAVEALLAAEPQGNITREQASDFVRKVLDGYDAIAPQLEAFAVERGEALLEAHLRVRQAAKLKGRQPQIEPHLPPDVLGVYVYLPAPPGSGSGD
jgi:hypothetical protein